MKRRILAGALSAALVLSLTGCQQTPAETSPTPSGSPEITRQGT